MRIGVGIGFLAILLTYSGIVVSECVVDPVELWAASDTRPIVVTGKIVVLTNLYTPLGEWIAKEP